MGEERLAFLSTFGALVSVGETNLSPDIPTRRSLMSLMPNLDVCVAVLHHHSVSC